MNCDKNDLLLYAVTDRHWLDGRRLIDVVRESLDGGVTMVQLREKTLEEGKFLEEAKELQTLCRERGVPFLVNDNVEIAREMNADGVHVGQSDMEAQDVRAILGPDKILGVSAQTVEQAVLAEKHGADYLGVGAVFPTGSKDDADDAQGHLRGRVHPRCRHRRHHAGKCREARGQRHLRRRGHQRDLRGKEHPTGIRRPEGRHGENAA